MLYGYVGHHASILLQPTVITSLYGTTIDIVISVIAPTEQLMQIMRYLRDIHANVCYAWIVSSIRWKIIAHNLSSCPKKE